jgi:signal transduction histidine kinase
VPPAKSADDDLTSPSDHIMSTREFQLQGLADPRLSVHATSPLPAWLWSTDGAQVLWTNAAGAQLLGAADVAALTHRTIGPSDPHRRQVAELAGCLSPTGAMRLERLRGFGASPGMLMTCRCTRLDFPDGRTGILIAPIEPPRHMLSIAEHPRGLVERIETQVDLPQLKPTPAADEPGPGFALADKPAELPESPAAPIADAPELPPPAASPAEMSPSAEPARRPLRFAWQMDTDGRFSLGSDEFTGLIGAHTAAGFGRPWQEISEQFGLDPAGRVVEAIATREAWSSITVYWPVDGGGRLPVEMSGFPICDSTQSFAGYRGFGVCRDLDSLAHLSEQRRLETLSDPPTPSALAADIVPAAGAATPASPQTDSGEPAVPPRNVVPFRLPAEARSLALTPAEDGAFNELARQLSARLDTENGSASEAGPTGEASSTPIEPPASEAAVEGPTDPAADDRPEWLRPAELPARGEAERDRTLLDLLPSGVLIYRLDRLLYANPAFLERLGYDSLHALEHAGGLDALYVEPGVSMASSTSEAGTPVTISAGHSASGPSAPTEARLFTISWDGDSALALMLAPASGGQSAAAEPIAAMPEAGHARAEDLGAILDAQSGRGESELQQARRLADRAANARADMIARISHEMRAPLNAIVGFAELMIGERFGTLGDGRYAEYLKDIRASGERAMAIIADLAELARVETGKIDLAFANQNLNELVESCVTVMQPQASRERIIIRTSLAHALPPVVADGRTLRQITLNLIGNSIHPANHAGQVIVSTALSDFGEVVLRVRDTGHGLNDNEVAAALEPFRSAPSSDKASEASPVNLSLTKALVEANRAQLHIKSGGRSGTLIEVVFPRALART